MELLRIKHLNVNFSCCDIHIFITTWDGTVSEEKIDEIQNQKLPVLALK